MFFEGRPGAGGENIVKYTELGKSGITVSKICAGGMSFGKPGTMHDWTLNSEDTE